MSYKEEKNNQIKAKVLDAVKELPEYAASYILSISGATSPSTCLEYYRDIRRFLLFVVESCVYDISDIRDITAEMLENLDVDFLNTYFNLYLGAYENNGKIQSNKKVSIRRKMSSVKSLYAFMTENELILKNPMLRIKPPKVTDKEIIYLNSEETHDFLKTVKHGKSNASSMQEKYHSLQERRDYALVNLLLGTGIRVSECVGLDIKDIDISHSALHITRKGGNEDVVYMNDDLTEIMADYLTYRKTLNPLPGHENALFLSLQRKRMGVRSVEVLIKKYKDQTGISKHITPHKLRSTYGTNLYEATGDLYLTAKNLGHRSVTTTEKFYSSMSEKHKYENRNAYKPTEHP